MEKLILKVENVTKQYKLGQIGGTTFREELQRQHAKLRRKEDPNRKIGSVTYQTNETITALDGVSFNVKKGERVGIIGHNGAGKSTLLKLITRVTAPTSGEIGLNGRVASMLEVGTGFHPELTGLENIYLNGAILGMKRKEIDAKIEDIVAFSECQKFIDTPVKRYSSGMKVKLAFSVAAHLDSEIMIMDEVLAVGDMAFQNKCLEKMGDVSKEEGRTILYVSHNMNTIRQLCDRCIVLSHGKLIFDGDVEASIVKYLNEDYAETGIYNDLRLRSRPGGIRGTAKLLDLEFRNTGDGLFERGTPLGFFFSWTAEEDLKQVYFRMIIHSADDVPVGLAQSRTLGDAMKGDKKTGILEFDTSLLVEGSYYISIELFQRDNLGNSVILDHVSRACRFEIIEKLAGDNRLKWEHRQWGSLRFPDLKEIKEVG